MRTSRSVGIYAKAGFVGSKRRGRAHEIELKSIRKGGAIEGLSHYGSWPKMSHNIYYVNNTKHPNRSFGKHPAC